MRDYQESVTNRQTDTHGGTDGQTDAGQSDPYVPLCFAGDTKKAEMKSNYYRCYAISIIKNIYVTKANNIGVHLFCHYSP